jgi:hypothetical protein
VVLEKECPRYAEMRRIGDPGARPQDHPDHFLDGVRVAPEGRVVGPACSEEGRDLLPPEVPRLLPLLLLPLDLDGGVGGMGRARTLSSRLPRPAERGEGGG